MQVINVFATARTAIPVSICEADIQKVVAGDFTKGYNVLGVTENHPELPVVESHPELSPGSEHKLPSERLYQIGAAVEQKAPIEHLNDIRVTPEKKVTNEQFEELRCQLCSDAWKRSRVFPSVLLHTQSLLVQSGASTALLRMQVFQRSLSA